MLPDIRHKRIVLALLGVELRYVVTKELCNDKISISEILQASRSIFYEIVQVIKLRLHLLPHTPQLRLVVLVIEQLVGLCDCIENHTIDACNECLVLVGFAQ